MQRIKFAFRFYIVEKIKFEKSGNENKIAAGDCFMNVVCVCGYVYKTISKAAKSNNNKKTKKL
jgi:hypothetical protein